MMHYRLHDTPEIHGESNTKKDEGTLEQATLKVFHLMCLNDWI